jgi:gamma-tubulin complex component 3
VVLVSKDPGNIRVIALREYTELVLDETEVSEAALVRNVLYACQGIDGRYVRYDKAGDAYDLPDGIRRATIHAHPRPQAVRARVAVPEGAGLHF